MGVKSELVKTILIFIRPSSDGTFYGMVMSVDLGLCPSVRPTLRPSDSLSGSPSARFPHFSHTCFDILSLILHMTLFQCTTDQV